MITPRTTRLVRAPDLRAVHHTLATCVQGVLDARATLVIVPTRGAGEALRATIEALLLRSGTMPAQCGSA